MTQALHEVNLYSRIDGSGYRNIWVVGDLHGCYTRLMSELHRVDFDPTQDLLISVGDLIDRGTENVECLELLQMPWFRSVMGNHERLMIDALSPAGNVNNWLMNGGQWFFMLDADREILARALVELVISNHKIAVLHPFGQVAFAAKRKPTASQNRRKKGYAVR